MNELRNHRILLGVTGSIAAYKSPEIIRLIMKKGGQVKVVLTQAGAKFITKTTLETVSGNRVAEELFPIEGNYDPVHISYARWCDALLIAPATANIIGKAAHGIADDLLSSIILAVEKPVLIAPAMNPSMFKHLAVAENMNILRSRGVRILQPDFGPLASTAEGSGIGRLPEPDMIVEWLIECLYEPELDMKGYRILITAGPTIESIDTVRFISNRSSGKMGVALAREAAQRGAEVVLIHGHVHTELPLNSNCIEVKTAQEMLKAVQEEYPHCQIAIMAAAVADFKPIAPSPSKIKKGESLILELVKNPDILEWMGANKKNHFLVGFALEDEEDISEARRKLREKNADLIVLNTIKALDANDNQITVVSSQSEERMPLSSKAAAAKTIINRISADINRSK